MQRTQMYLDDQLRKDLRTLAKKESKSMAEIAREILQEGVKKKKNEDSSGMEIMLSLLSINAKGGPKDLAINHDHYLYGGPKKKTK